MNNISKHILLFFLVMNSFIQYGQTIEFTENYINENISKYKGKTSNVNQRIWVDDKGFIKVQITSNYKNSTSILNYTISPIELTSIVNEYGDPLDRVFGGVSLKCKIIEKNPVHSITDIRVKCIERSNSDKQSSDYYDSIVIQTTGTIDDVQAVNKAILHLIKLAQVRHISYLNNKKKSDPFY